MIQRPNHGLCSETSSTELAIKDRVPFLFIGEASGLPSRDAAAKRCRIRAASTCDAISNALETLAVWQDVNKTQDAGRGPVGDIIKQ